MPANFKEAKTELLQFAKRSTTESRWDSMAGSIINESQNKLQRLLPNLNALTKIVTDFTYPANKEQVSFTDAVNATDINKIISVHVTSQEGGRFGKPLRLFTAQQLTQAMEEFDDRTVREQYAELETYNYLKHVSDVHGQIGYLLETDLCIYPTPSRDLRLSILYTPWLEHLSLDTDTNFLLKYCWDFIFYSSLLKLNIFLSEEDRIEVSNAMLNYALNEVRSWNASLNYSNPVEM